MPPLPLKTDPKYGYFPRWPQDGNGWIHPDDVGSARAMIPSGRVFRRDGTAAGYVLLHYGEVTLRVRPVLWQEVEPEGLEIGDWVEVLSRGMLNEPRTGTLREMLWDENARRCATKFTKAASQSRSCILAQDLRLVEPVN